MVKFLQLKTILPIYAPDGRYIEAWQALYELSLPLAPAQDSLPRPPRVLLEGEYLSLELRGAYLAKAVFAHLPVQARRGSDLFAERFTQPTAMLFKRVNGRFLAPFFMGENGASPACKEAVAVGERYVSIKESPKRILPPCGALLELELIRVAAPSSPGLARIVIYGEYIVVSEGVFLCETNHMNPKVFEETFAKGNSNLDLFADFDVISREGFADKTPIVLLEESDAYIAALNVYKKEDRASGLSRKEIKFRQASGYYKRKFGFYYETKIEYQYSLNLRGATNLADALLWKSACPNRRGIICSMPFTDLLEELWRKSDDAKNRLAALKRELIKSGELNPQLPLSDEKIKLKYKYSVSVGRYYRNKIVVFFIMELLAKGLIRVEAEGFYINYYEEDISRIFPDRQFTVSGKTYKVLRQSDRGVFEGCNSLLDNVELHCSKFRLNAHSFLNTISKLAMGLFEAQKTLGGDVYAIGKLSTPNKTNLIVLNLEKFKKVLESTQFQLSHTIVLVHEVGHNLAETHYHKNNNYKYNQTGLQSNKDSDCYPTVSNTLSILNDSANWLALILFIFLPFQDSFAQHRVSKKEWRIIEKVIEKKLNPDFEDISYLEPRGTTLYCSDVPNCQDHIRVTYFSKDSEFYLNHGYFLHYNQDSILDLRRFIVYDSFMIIIPTILNSYENNFDFYKRYGGGSKKSRMINFLEIYHPSEMLKFVIVSSSAKMFDLHYFPYKGERKKQFDFTDIIPFDNKYKNFLKLKSVHEFKDFLNKINVSHLGAYKYSFQEYISGGTIVIYEFPSLDYLPERLCSWNCNIIFKIKEMQETTGQACIDWRGKRYHKVGSLFAD